MQELCIFIAYFINRKHFATYRQHKVNSTLNCPLVVTILDSRSTRNKIVKDFRMTICVQNLKTVREWSLHKKASNLIFCVSTEWPVFCHCLIPFAPYKTQGTRILYTTSRHKSVYVHLYI